jgi:xanthine dehydrogenase accessory factor
MFDDLLKLASELQSRSQPFVLATVVGCKPPTSARTGAKAIVRADGSFDGWVGGSCAQPLVIEEAFKALQDGQTRVMILAPDPAEVDFGFESFVPVPMTCQSEGTLAIYLEPFLPKPRLVVIGASPVARSLAHQGNSLGFRVCAGDPAASREMFPGAEIVVRDLSAITPAIDGAGTYSAPGYIVVATMGHYDEAALESALDRPSRYVGLVASPRRGKAVVDYLARKGISAESLRKVKYPAGLDLGAETPEEIALSILGEIVQKMRAEGRGIGLEQFSPGATNGTTNGTTTATDPICNMTVSTADARYVSTYQDNTFYFCCANCKEAFDQDPPRTLPQAIG